MTVVVLTGATRGIGLAAAEAFGRRGVDLVLVGRDAARVKDAARLAEQAGATATHEVVADLASLADVRAVAEQVRAQFPKVDVLANNAGAMFTSRHVTPDGLEQTIALNHLAPFLLTHLLLDRLAGGRVVTTSSDAHRVGRLDLTNLQAERGGYRAMRVYGTSKLANVLFTRELQRRHPELTATCFHPGVIRTGFGKNDSPLVRFGVTLMGPFLEKPPAAADRLLRLALDPVEDAERGGYFEKNRLTTPSEQARDDALAAALWQRSAELTGVA